MRIAIKEILADHRLKTGEKLSQDALAREMVAKGIFSSFWSARNTIQYNINGSAKSLDIPMIEFLQKRFDLTIDQIIL